MISVTWMFLALCIVSGVWGFGWDQPEGRALCLLFAVLFLLSVLAIAFLKEDGLGEWDDEEYDFHD